MKWLNNYFNFNKQERNGVLVLCSLIILLLIVKTCLPYFIHQENTIVLTELKTVIESPVPYEKKEYSDYKKQDETAPLVNRKLFVFNPNTITYEEAIELGFPAKTAHILINFRNKGAKFYNSESLKKLYGLSPKLFSELEPYILIPNTKKEFKNDSAFYTKSNYPKPIYEKKVYPKTIIDINTADSLAIVYLKGIGPGFTKRIIKYRTMLGGFHSMNQLKEVYGMNDSLFTTLSSQIKVDENTLTKIPINAIDFNSLRKHPYFNFQTAQAVINYKFKHGRLTENDFKNLGIFSEEKLKMILPYLSY